MSQGINVFLPKITKIVKTKGRKKCSVPQKADKEIKYCVSCFKCWEKKCRPNSSKIKYNWYEDFPVYGKEKQICPKCQNTNN